MRADHTCKGERRSLLVALLTFTFERFIVITRVETISPERAEEYLKQNTGNFRSIDNSRLDRYVKEMKSGNWKLTGDTIKFDSDGMLVDGQHRLVACVMSKCSLTTVVAENCQGMEYMDRGKPRTVSQWLKHLGIKNATNIASISKSVLCHDAGLWKHRSWGINTYTDSEQIAFAVEHHKRLQDVYNMTYGCNVSRTLLGTIFFVGSLNHDSPHDSDTLVWYCNALRDGSNLSERDPVLHFRNRIISNSSAINKVTNFMMRQLCTLSWNMTVKGLPCSQLSLKLTGPKAQKPINQILIAND